MSDTRNAAAMTDTPTDLPSFAGKAAQEQPALWAALQELGKQASDAGPLDARSRRLVNLALAIGCGSEGATHSHSRRGLAEGLSSEELEHVAWLAVTTLGWPQAIKGLTWVRDITQPTTRG